MISNLDYRIRSFFLKLDRRDYKSSIFLAFIYKLLNPIKFFKQNFLNIISENEKNLQEEGFKQYSFESENLEKIIKRSNKIINSKFFYQQLDSSKKKFLQSYKINFFNKENHIYLKLLFENKFLNIIRGYLGKHLTLKEINIFYSPNSNFEKGRSQEFHMDGDGNKQIKIFLYLNDVDSDGGPLTILPKKISRKIFDIMKKKKRIVKKTNRVDDDSIRELNCEKYLKPLYGNTGTINLVDTSNCYHFGSRPGKKERFIVLYQFLDSFSYYLPSKSSKEKVISSSDILNAKEIKIINNIVQYSN